MNDNCGSAWQLLWLNLCFYTIKWPIPSNTWHTLNDNCTRSLLGTSETKTFLLVPVKDQLESQGGLALLDDFLGHCSCCVWGVPSAGLPCCSAKGPVPQLLVLLLPQALPWAGASPAAPRPGQCSLAELSPVAGGHVKQARTLQYAVGQWWQWNPLSPSWSVYTILWDLSPVKGLWLQ